MSKIYVPDTKSNHSALLTAITHNNLKLQSALPINLFPLTAEH